METPCCLVLIQFSVLLIHYHEAKRLPFFELLSIHTSQSFIVSCIMCALSISCYHSYYILCMYFVGNIIIIKSAYSCYYYVVLYIVHSNGRMALMNVQTPEH